MALEEHLDRAERYGRQRKWQEMRIVADATLSVVKWRMCKPAWHQLILACRMLDEHDQAESYLQEARECCGDNWTVLDDGDVLRDYALALIRPLQTLGMEHSALTEARDVLDRVYDLHRTDNNRLICARVVAGRIAEAQGDYEVAQVHYRWADDAWRRLARAYKNTFNKADIPFGDIPNPQWRFNLLPHWQRVANRRMRYILAVWLGWRTLRGVRQYGSWKHAMRALAMMLPGLWWLG